MGLARTAPRAPRTTSPAPRAAPAPASQAAPVPRALPGLGGLVGRYDQIIDAMNRLPRPALMVLTVALFAYAALDPTGFAARMQALAEVPEPLWWMQGAIVTFYFGAREAHYSRQGKRAASAASKPETAPKTP
jgi:Holin of 3TMs, for gene-transfer release